MRACGEGCDHASQKFCQQLWRSKADYRKNTANKPLHSGPQSPPFCVLELPLSVCEACLLRRRNYRRLFCWLQISCKSFLAAVLWLATYSLLQPPSLAGPCEMLVALRFDLFRGFSRKIVAKTRSFVRTTSERATFYDFCNCRWL